MAKQIDWLSIAKFLDSDYTLDFIPDIVYPTDSQVKNSKLRWFAEKLEEGYKEFISAPVTADDDELTMDDDDEL